ncbi:hypothetical protein ACQBAT_13540 [Ornithinimicrobium sp. Y1847]|uniref:hypothetical protein n=1 Tax=unclassified Ornithinimicrobium TaxID=2615080 RepID=UPI003B66F3C3
MNWVDLIGWGGSIVLVVSLLQTRVLRLRLINLVGSLVLLAYNAIIEVWPMVGLNTVLSLINIFFLWRLLRDKDDATAYTVIEVNRDDAYLEHVLSVHQEDIARHNPGFRSEPERGDCAFLVLHGDETVGVVLAREAGEGLRPVGQEAGRTAEIALDWVTPRHRDFAPGKFVFGESGLFAKRGYTRVLSPAGMTKPYYEQIGFRPEGDRWVLDV